VTEAAGGHCIVEAAVMLLGHEGNGGHRSAGLALLGQEGGSVRLKKGSDNQHVVAGGMWQGTGVVGHGVHHGRRW
jgi:hypothetical protein